MEQLQDAASQQVKLVADRVNELLSSGLGLLHSELGVDLGLKPELIPPWVILLAACTGLVLMVALWASACRAVFKKRPAVSPVDDGTEVKRGVTKPQVKSEEPKKKKKKSEKARSINEAILHPFQLDSRTVSRASCQANTAVTVGSHVMAKALASFRPVSDQAMLAFDSVICYLFERNIAENCHGLLH